MAVWSTYLGTLEPKHPAMVFSRFRGNPPLVELVSEGKKVTKGEVLARLDSTTVERDILKQEKDYAVAQSDLIGFQDAKAPLEVKELSIKLADTRANLASEQNYLHAVLGLARDGLVSEQELARQKEKVAGLKTQAEEAALRLRLTREYLHPAEVKRLLAKLAAAKNELQLAREQLRQSVIRAPSDGVVIYTPVHVGLELRAVRVGDALPANVTFMTLHDSADMVIHCEVPEGELSRVEAGQETSVQMLAYPTVRLRAKIEAISPMAQAAPGRPLWQKTFRVVIRIVDPDPRLRPGMSVVAHVLSYSNAQALAIPRSAVAWENGKALVTVLDGGAYRRREVAVGHADDQSYEVLGGLQPGSEVVVR